MSLKPTIRLNINDELQERILETHKTAGLYLQDLIKNIENTPLSTAPVFKHEVYFLDLERTGFYTGIIASHFWLSTTFNVKTTSGEVIRISFF